MRIALFLLTLLLMTSASAEANLVYSGNPFSAVDPNGLSPFWDWKTIETEHFRVTFPKELLETAQLTTDYFEETHAFLSPLFRWTPHTKTQVILVDNRDLPNGLASPIGRYGIVLWLTPPDPWSGMYYYDHWLRQLVVHEYTHYLNMDTTNGIWEPLRYVFGSTLLPNSFWPPWMLEGLAVYMETRFSRAGRGRSPYYEMLLRSAVENHLLDSSEFITLDKINGTNPYFPFGDTRYQFGYQLMNQVAQNPSTLDSKKADPTHNEEILGILSEHSSSRFPFLINTNLKDTTQSDWYSYWDLWVSETNTRIKKELEKIHSQPTTPFVPILDNQHEISPVLYGVTISPDENWLAFTLASSDRRSGLYLRNLKTGQTTRLLDKMLGIGISFTPDSNHLIYSRLRQSGQYEQWSDLETYSLIDQSTHWLTHNLRARDPGISPDGKYLVFTLTENQTTGLALVPLALEKDSLELGSVEKIWMPPRYDRVGNPQFSHDGQSLYFSYHPNGKVQENILELELSTHQVKTLIENGKFNRFPILSNSNSESLFYISDLTGVENLYRFDFKTKESSLITNFTTGLNYPSFGPRSHTLYGGVFTVSGWNLARIDLPENLNSISIPTQSITLNPPPAPQVGPNSSTSQTEASVYEAKNYSVFPSILPRSWLPLIGYDLTGISIGAQVLGFDAINNHRYLLGGTYNTRLNVTDWSALYSTRIFGPNVSLSASTLSINSQQLADSIFFRREMKSTLGIQYPVLWTYSNLSPYLGMNLLQYKDYFKDSSNSQNLLYNTTPLVSSFDSLLRYSDLEVSPLSISPEAGRTVTLGSRFYAISQEQVWKALLTSDQYFRLGPHSILNPSLKGIWTSRLASNYSPASAYLQGRSPFTIFNPFPSDEFRQLSIRGYPNTLTQPSRGAGVGALNFNFPISRIFRGLGTLPTFLDNLYGVSFTEVSYLSQNQAFLPSAGAGLRLSAEILFIPVVFSTEYHKGFRQDLGGANDFFFQVLTQSVNF